MGTRMRQDALAGPAVREARRNTPLPFVAVYPS